jgi:hypothetical protein
MKIQIYIWSLFIPLLECWYTNGRSGVIWKYKLWPNFIIVKSVTAETTICIQSANTDDRSLLTPCPVWKEIFKQWWSTIPPISTKQTATFYVPLTVWRYCVPFSHCNMHDKRQFLKCIEGIPATDHQSTPGDTVTNSYHFCFKLYDHVCYIWMF